MITISRPVRVVDLGFHSMQCVIDCDCGWKTKTFANKAKETAELHREEDHHGESISIVQVVA